MSNLSALAESGTSIQRQVHKTPSGYHFAIWFGDRFTSSCILHLLGVNGISWGSTLDI
jgi:hypothetical protein